jgi:hypothetical protein
MRRLAAAAAVTLSWALACAGPQPQSQPQQTAPETYRLANSGKHWDRSGNDRVRDDMMERYPEYFAVLDDQTTNEDLDYRALRNDLERMPPDRRNYDALNTLAIGYFELNFRAERNRGGSQYLIDSLRVARCLAVPWRAYGEIDDGPLRDAILDFFADIARGEKLLSAQTGSRVAKVVASLEEKEPNEARRERIQDLVERLSTGS